MKIEFSEYNNTEIPNTRTLLEPKKIKHDGRTYTYTGKKLKNLSTSNKVKVLFECMTMSIASLLILPLFFKGFRKYFKMVRKEFSSGKQTVKYYVLKPAEFVQAPKKPIPPTAAESFIQGYEESQNKKFD